MRCDLIRSAAAHPTFSKTRLIIRLIFDLRYRGGNMCSRANRTFGDRENRRTGRNPMWLITEPRHRNGRARNIPARIFFRFRSYGSSFGEPPSPTIPRIDWELIGRRVTRSSIRARFMHSPSGGTRNKNTNVQTQRRGNCEATPAKSIILARLTKSIILSKSLEVSCACAKPIATPRNVDSTHAIYILRIRHAYMARDI